MTQSVVPPREQTQAPAWHALDHQEALRRLHSDPDRGLTSAEAASRLQQYGPNALQTMHRTPWYVVLARQFMSVLILILLVAAVVALFIGDATDTVAILGIVLLNGILGFVQEWKAERAVEALQRMLAPQCKVVRDGQAQEVNTKDLVPGDIVLLEVGDNVPADLRVVEELNLKTDESSLTGESVSVDKNVEPVESAAPLAERSSIAWMGTAVTNGRASGLVVATGTSTEFGRIAQLTQTVGQTTTPLQRKLATLGKQLGVLSLAVSLGVAVTGWLMGKPLLEMFLTGVSLAVAVVPEGLPAVVTITLALGIHAMAQRRALLRRLQAAESLGAATVICTDKTGTLTQNQMTVQRIWLPAGDIKVSGVGYQPRGRFEQDGQELRPDGRYDLLALLETGLRCNHAHVFEDDGGWHEVGEPTEAALIVAAYKAGLRQDERHLEVTEFSFDSRRKRMTVVEQHPEGLKAYAKGAPEVILERCNRILDGAQEREITEAERKAVAAAYQDLSEGGLRVLALAWRTLPEGAVLSAEDVERELVLLGLVGIIDPPRPEVPDAIRLAKSAGIQVIMITGDASATAAAVAQRVGLRAERVVTGSELSAMDDAALREALQQEVLFARTTPENKVRIVSALQAQGHIVGMTGDGVNDAPALKQAEIGIAMGLRGTDVAKGAADLILTDDNFASIIGAVEEGRRQYSNIQKFVRYLLTSNTAEVVAIFIGILLGGPLVLLPVQILWINLFTDGMTAVALGLEPVEKGIMHHPPRSPRAAVLDLPGAAWVLLLGGYMGLATLWLHTYYENSGHENPVALAQTAAFTGLVLLESVNLFNFRSLRQPLATTGFFSNPRLLLAVAATIVVQLGAVYVPFLQRALHTVPLGWDDWFRMLVVASPVFVVAEAYKVIRWRRDRASSA